MKPLKKPTKAKNCQNRKRFEKVCEEVRRALHLEHWACKYWYEEDKEGNTSAMEFYAQVGRRIEIDVFDCFFEQDSSKQLTDIIHEHLHAVQNGVLHFWREVVDKALHHADYKMLNEGFHQHNEKSTDHLAAVLYDLIKDRFDNL